MKKLSSNQQSFIKLMTESTDQAQRGFDFFSSVQTLRSSSMRSPRRTCSIRHRTRPPCPATGLACSGYRFGSPSSTSRPSPKFQGKGRMPASRKSDARSAKREWMADPDGIVRDNYHTFHAFARIIGLVPSAVVALGDIDLIPTWLEGRFIAH